jgi:hypothetical protein
MIMRSLRLFTGWCCAVASPLVALLILAGFVAANTGLTVKLCETRRT